MAVTKILARDARLDQAIQYVLNGDKTDHQILTAHQNCDPGWKCRQMRDTKREFEKLDGCQRYHIIQSFKPGEVTPELALEIATGFAAEYLADYEVVIGTHVERGHIHSHLVFNSVNAQTGEKYHITTQGYYRQIRTILDRLCRQHGSSVIMEGQPSQTVSYIEWLRQSKGQPTFRSMLEADLRSAIEDANDLSHFFMLMEHRGYEIHHGDRLGFRLRGQERFMYPERKDPLFTEDGIRATILGNLTKQRTILNVKKKKHRPLYTALTDAAALAQAKAPYEKGLSGMEIEFSRYMEAVAVLEQCGIPRERIEAEKAELYEQLAQINRDIRAARKKLALCREIQSQLPQMERTIKKSSPENVSSTTGTEGGKTPPAPFRDTLRVPAPSTPHTRKRTVWADKKEALLLLN